MAIACYDPDRIALVLVGIPVNSGFASDSMVKVSEREEGFGVKVGVLGEVTRYKMLNRVQKLILSTQYGAKINDVLSALYNLDQSQPNGAGVGPTSITDLNGTTMLFAAESWISKAPQVEYGKEPKELEWEITLNVATENIGSL